jgi:hypothetical protein
MHDRSPYPSSPYHVVMDGGVAIRPSTGPIASDRVLCGRKLCDLSIQAPYVRIAQRNERTTEERPPRRIACEQLKLGDKRTKRDASAKRSEPLDGETDSDGVLVLTKHDRRYELVRNFRHPREANQSSFVRPGTPEAPPRRVQENPISSAEFPCGFSRTPLQRCLTRRNDPSQ